MKKTIQISFYKEILEEWFTNQTDHFSNNRFDHPDLSRAWFQGGKLSLELEGVTLEKALGEIESRSEYRFMYEYSQIPLQEKVTLKASNQYLD